MTNLYGKQTIIKQKTFICNIDIVNKIQTKKMFFPPKVMRKISKATEF